MCSATLPVPKFSKNSTMNSLYMYERPWGELFSMSVFFFRVRNVACAYF